MMNRRGFLTFLGAAVAGAALPMSLLGEKIARAPAWAKQVLRFSCGPLAAGHYTFSAWAKKQGEPWGLYVAGVTATGGETIFEIPLAVADGDVLDLSDQKIVVNGIQLEIGDRRTINFAPGSIPEGPRGAAVKPT